MEKISAETVAALSETEQLYLYLFAFEGSERKVGDFSFPMRTRFGRQMTPGTSDQICRLLLTRGILRCTANFATVLSRKYALAVRLSFDAARVLIVRARERRWLPLKDNGVLMLASILDGGRNFREEQDGGGYDSYYRYGYGNGALWYAATYLAGMMDEKSVLPEMKFPPKTSDRVYRVLSSVLFCRGFDVVPVLMDWRDKHQKSGWGRGVAEWDACEYAALCFWTGRMDLLDVFDRSDECPGVVSDFVAGCVAVSKGDLERAYKCTAGIVDMIPARSSESEEIAFSTPACHLFALAVSAFHKPMKTRLAKLALKLCPQKSNFKYELPSSARTYFERRMEESAGLVRFLGGWTGGYPESPDSWCSPTCRTGEIFLAVTSAMNRRAIEEYAPKAFRLAEKAASAGYPSVASMFVSAFGWALKGEDAEKSKALADAITKSGGWRMVSSVRGGVRRVEVRRGGV